MSKANARASERSSYWKSLSEEELLSAELTTDDPESLEGLVFVLPEGDEEPYVEFSYDLRGSGRESLHCVHENHAHLKGFVMRKGDKRFLVGHVCGEKIYGQKFEDYKTDFNEAVNRQDVARRSRRRRQ